MQLAIKRRRQPPPKTPGPPTNRTIDRPSIAVDRRLAALPTGRAVVGGLLVAVAALGLFSAWQRATRHTSARYLVAAHDLPTGTVLSADSLATVDAQVTGAPARQLFASADALIGQVTTAPLASGELVSASMVRSANPAAPIYELAVSLTTDAALAGQVKVGERVTVVATDDHCTSVVAANVAVQRLDDRGDTLSAGKYIVNLRLDNAAQVLALAQATRAGTVSLARSDGSIPAAVCGRGK
ncbi:MAG: hypothetical protein JWL70_1399 [Acidimicrobiia bacterium]|nr:hypothetical protein [Acidimicrobiia bacterium]